MLSRDKMHVRLDWPASADRIIIDSNITDCVCSFADGTVPMSMYFRIRSVARFLLGPRRGENCLRASTYQRDTIVERYGYLSLLCGYNGGGGR